VIPFIFPESITTWNGTSPSPLIEKYHLF